MERYNLLALAAAPGRSRDRRLGMGRTRRRGPPGGRQDRCGPGPATRGRDPRPRCRMQARRSTWGSGRCSWRSPRDADAGSAISAARAGGMTVNRANRGLLLDGRGGHRRPPSTGKADAEELLDRGRADLVHYPVWSDLALLLAAEAALADGWGDPRRWLAHGLRDIRAPTPRAVAAPRSCAHDRTRAQPSHQHGRDRPRDRGPGPHSDKVCPTGTSRPA